MQRVSWMSVALLIASTLIVAGCGGGGASDGSGNGNGGDGATPQTSAADMPTEVFAAAPPGDVVPLIDAKTAAAPGDRVVFEARIGGRVEPFLDKQAIFFVTDPSIPDCSQLHGDTCPTPWDYCCEPKDNLLKHMATVQIVDADARPLAMSARGQHGLEPGRTVLIEGTVGSKEDGGAFVVNAESIYVLEG